MNNNRLQNLLIQYFDNTISTSDCVELFRHIESISPEELADIVNEIPHDLDIGPEFKGAQAQRVFQDIKSDPRYMTARVQQEHSDAKVVKLYQGRWFKVAVVIVICGILSLFVFRNRSITIIKDLAPRSEKAAVIIPGGRKAILTFSSGKKVILDNGQDSLISKSGNLSISNTHKQELVYVSATGNDHVEISKPLMNVLSTPRGGEYQVTLADGTRVWLNCASSLSYPEEFAGNERHVTLSGEAYFEVAKDKSKPFFVNVNNVEIKVLGTHFNVAAYKDDHNITATLLEGSVQFSKKGRMVLLKPGEQAVVNDDASDIRVSAVDVTQAMAWKNGYFIFNNDDIKSVMEKVSRWYDVDVKYQGDFKNQRFGGTYYRSKHIAELLHYFEKIGNVRFRIEGRRIIVME